MTDPHRPDSAASDQPVHLKTLRCRRTGQMFTVERHVECPYCSGDAQRIQQSHEYKEFCEFRPGQDPINFGFPPDSTRTRHG